MNVFGSRRWIQIGMFALLIGFVLILRYVSNMKIIFNNSVTTPEHHSSLASLVIVPASYSAPQKAFCLDGTNPGYFFRQSSSSKVKNWTLHIPVGAWCTSKKDCLHRSLTRLGSTKHESKQRKLAGIMDSDCRNNPEFCNWNAVEFIYCDGGSFAGSLQEPVQEMGKDIYLRGAAIFDVLIQHLLDTTKLYQAQNILLTGSSAGSLATLINADHLRDLLPSTVTIKALVDGGMFLDQLSIDDGSHMKDMLKSTFDLHNIKECRALKPCLKEKPDELKWQCFMPEYLHTYVKTPVFFLNSFYDTWYYPAVLKVHCSSRAMACDMKSKAVLESVIKSIKQTANQILTKSENGVYITSCPVHTVLNKNAYFRVRANDTTPAQAVQLWMNKHDKVVNITHLESHLTSSRNC